MFFEVNDLWMDGFNQLLEKSISPPLTLELSIKEPKLIRSTHFLPPPPLPLMSLMFFYIFKSSIL